MTTADVAEFLAELVSQLFHADVLITDQAEPIEALEAKVARLKRARRSSPSQSEGASVTIRPGWGLSAAMSGAKGADRT
jgi:hypothetical protein